MWAMITRWCPAPASYTTSGDTNPIDLKAYRRRNVIERLFCRLKNWRRLATRYDRLARNYMAALALAAIVTAWNV
jgi:transposase